jgi:hypothetical protein
MTHESLNMIYFAYVHSVISYGIIFWGSSTYRQIAHLHLPANKLAKVQKGVYFSGIRAFNNLPQSIRDLSSDVINFKQALKKFLLFGSFYSLNEY